MLYPYRVMWLDEYPKFIKSDSEFDPSVIREC